METDAPENKISFSLVTPSRLLFEGEVDYAQIPLHDGLMGILPGHSPLVGLLGFGLLTNKNDNQETKFVIDGGFVEILPYKITLLANHAEKLDEVDADGASSSLQEALKEAPVGDVAIQDNADRIAAARTRIKYSDS